MPAPADQPLNDAPSSAKQAGAAAGFVAGGFSALKGVASAGIGGAVKSSGAVAAAKDAAIIAGATVAEKAYDKLSDGQKEKLEEKVDGVKAGVQKAGLAAIDAASGAVDGFQKVCGWFSAS